MSETETKIRTRSQTNSKRASRDSSREPSTSRSKVSNSDREKIKGILKSKVNDKNMEPSESGLTSAADSSAAESDGDYDTANYDSDSKGGILDTLKNLQYGTHVALRGKGKHSALKADKLIKAGSNRNLVTALKQERLKGAEIYAALLEGGGHFVDTDIPHFKAFDKHRPPCSSEEFEKQLRMMQRNYSRFEGRCAEFIYFLLDIEAMKKTFNITNDQLAHILQNRLGGRLQKYFMIQMKRNGDVVAVLNRLGKDYVETVDTAAEVEKCATFKFQYKNIVDELIRLKEMIAMAYPNTTDDELRQIYIQKVTDKVPAEVRLALTEDFQRQRQRINLGMPPLNDDEIDSHIIKHMKSLERRHNKTIYKVKSRAYPSFDEDSVISEDSISVVNSNAGNDKSFLEGFVRSVQQIATSAALSSDNNQPQPPHNGQKSPPRFDNRNKGVDFHPHNNGSRPPWQKKGDLYERPNFNRAQTSSAPQNRFAKKGNGNDKLEFLLAKSSDVQYPILVNEIKTKEDIKYLGQKIRNDFRNIKNEKFKQDLQRLRTHEAGSSPIYTLDSNGRYRLDDCPMITGPIIKKVGNYSPQLTAEVMRRFAGRCHACGFATCPQKGNPQKAAYKCIYEKKADSWWPCEKCMRGFHLSKDCLALVKN